MSAHIEQDGGAAERLARLVQEVARWGNVQLAAEEIYGPPIGETVTADLRAVLAENKRLRMDLDAARGYVAAAERATVNSPHVRDLTARLDAVRRLCDEADSRYDCGIEGCSHKDGAAVPVSRLRAVLSSSGGTS